MSVSKLPTEDLQFDGERFIPGAGVEIAYHHWLRYQHALRLAAGKRVLDVACGEGYGAAMMAAAAREVTAFDGSERAIRHARGAYADRANVVFECAPLQEFFAKAPARSFDLVTAFEIIEHVDERSQRELVQGIRRVLAPGGLGLISTPDKRLYTDAKLSKNPFHVREMYRREFDALMREGFPHVRMLEQAACTGAAIFERGARTGELTTAAWTDLVRLQGGCEPGLEGEGEYIVAIVSDQPIPEEATKAIAILDPAKKLIGEELYNTHVALETAKRTESSLREELAQADVRENSELRRRLAVMEEVADRLAAAAARAQDEITKAQRLESELQHVRNLYNIEHHALVHLRQMLGVRVVLKAKAALDKAPALKRAVRGLTRLSR